MSRVSQSSAGRSQVNIAGTVPVESIGFDVANPSQITVGLTSTQLFAPNPNRQYAHISNNSGDTIYIQYTNPAVLNQGIKLPPNTFYTIEFNNLWLGAVNAVGVVSSQLIDILEGE